MKPSLKEVKEYFKDAKIVRDRHGDETIYDKNKIDNSFHYNIFTDHNEKEPDVILWGENQGYAEILTYKKPKMKITKKQIKQLDKGEVTVRELFPDVFEKEVKFTGWAKDDVLPLWLGYYENDVFKYGIDSLGHWVSEDVKESKYSKDSSNRPATDQEVTEALTKESVKKGFKKGVRFIRVNSITNECISIFNDVFKNDLLLTDKGLMDDCNYILCNGKWATIIETITKAEAEKELGKTIID